MVVGFLGLTASSSFAQIGDVGRILQSSAEDANILVKQYLKPFGSGFGAGLNSGWTNTARPHKKFGFDLTVSSGLAVVPSSDKSFQFDPSDYQQLELTSGPSTLQTINGKSDVQASTIAAFGDDYNQDGQPDKLFEFNMPKGTGFGYVPAPEIKGAVGLIKDTELMLRFVPKIKIGDYGKFDQFGFGVKHGINQWLPGGSAIPIDLSIMAGYTKQTVSSDFRITDDDVLTPETRNRTEIPSNINSSTWDGQQVKIETNAFTVNALVGKTLPFISFYGGVGFESSTMTIATPGQYPTIEEKANPTPQEPFILRTLDRPVDVEIDGENGFHGLAGFRLKLAFFHISGSYKLANYSTFNAGIGFSFR
jgi:hypothetical protein